MISFSPFEYGVVTCLVMRRLGGDYMIGPSDIEWLECVSKFFDAEEFKKKKKATSKMMVDAFVKAQEKHGCDIHIDPFELCIDAGFCDKNLVPTNLEFSKDAPNNSK